MCKLDQEDITFLEDLIEELPKIEGNMYKSESEELGNILYRLTEVPIYSRVKFICKKCGQESWFEVNLNRYVVSMKDLLCDDCNTIVGQE